MTDSVRRTKMSTHHRKIVDALLLFILILLPLLFFWRLVTPNPADQLNIAAGDFTEQYFPLRAFSAQEWVRGNIPLWNPCLYGGQPALADIQSGALYPPHIIQSLILGWAGPLLGQEIGFPLKALEWQVIFHFSLAAAGTCLFVRHLLLHDGYRMRQARFGGMVASLVFTYGGYLTGFPVQQMTILAASAWLPWVMWGFSVANRQACQPVRLPRTRAATGVTYVTYGAQYIFCLAPVVAWSALAFALAILAGHPQTVLYIFYLTLVYALFLSFLQWHKYKTCGNLDNSRRVIYQVLQGARPLLIWLAMILFGVALAAAQLLPTLEFIAHSVRADLSYSATSAGLPLTELVAVLYPGFFGGSPEYIGIASLVLIAVALAVAGASVGQRGVSSAPHIFFWAGAGLFSVLLAFGNNLFWYPLFYLFAPGFDAVRQQERVFLIYSFSGAVMAGYGAAILAGTLLKSTRQPIARFERGLKIVTVAAFFVTGLFIYGSTAATIRGDDVNLFYGVLWHHLFGLMILTGMVLLLLLRSRRRLRTWWGMALLALLVAFNLFTVNWRFNLAHPDDGPSFTPNGVVQFLQDKVGPQLQKPGRIASGGLLPEGNSAASVYNLQDLTGNTPLQLAGVDNFMQRMPAWRLWQLMNVRYIVEQRDIGDPGLRLVFEEDDLKVFEMGDPFERAWFVSETEVLADDDRAMARLAADDFDLRQTVVVPQRVTATLTSAETSTVAFKKFSPTHLALTVNASGTHLLVLSQIYYPGWQVLVDDQPAELLRVNVVQQGVIVPAGKHLIQFLYWPTSFGLGLVISMGALLLVGAVLTLSWLVPLNRHH